MKRHLRGTKATLFRAKTACGKWLNTVDHWVYGAIDFSQQQTDVCNKCFKVYGKKIK